MSSSPNLSKNLLLHLDGNRTPDPQIDTTHRVSLIGSLPFPSDGIDTWECGSSAPILAWKFGVPDMFTGDDSAQVFEPPQSLGKEFTIGFWLRFDQEPERPIWDDVPTPILHLGRAYFLALGRDGLALSDGSNPSISCVPVPRDRWLLLLISCSRFSGVWSVFGAWDTRCVRHLGDLSAPSDPVILTQLGGSYPDCMGSGCVSQILLWNRFLRSAEHLELFATDAVRYNCLSNAQAEALSTGGPVPRDAAQEAEFQHRLELVRSGGQAVVADFANFVNAFQISYLDLPQILEAAAEGDAKQLLLGGSLLLIDDIRDIIENMRQGRIHYADVCGCSAVAELGQEVLNTFPFDRGCSMEAAGCGLSNDSVVQLRNLGRAAEKVSQIAIMQQQNEQACAEYMTQLEALEDFAAEECEQDSPPAPPLPLHHPKKWRKGIDGPARAEYNAFCMANMNGFVQDGDTSAIMDKNGTKVSLSTDEISALTRQFEQLLKDEGCIFEADEGEDTPFSPDEARGGSPGAQALLAAVRTIPNGVAFMLWNGAKPTADSVQEARHKREEWEAIWREKIEKLRKLRDASKAVYDVGSGRPFSVASGQLIAHFTYLCLNGNLTGEDVIEPYQRFGLKYLKETRRTPLRRNTDLHSALASGQVRIDAAIGRSYGKDSLELSLRNTGSETCQVVVRHGTIFQHIDWQHRQNLLIAIDYTIRIPAGEVTSKKMMAFCMNSTCACARGNQMELTEFYCDDADILASQGDVWKHFQSTFAGGKSEYSRPTATVYSS